MALASDAEIQPAGGWLRVPIHGEFYVGLGVCSHDKDVVEQAVFSNVELTQPSAAAGEGVLYSTLETVTVDSADRRVVYLTRGRFEAPNWTRDWSAFLFNQRWPYRAPRNGQQQARTDRHRFRHPLQ